MKVKKVANWEAIDYKDGKPTTAGQYCVERKGIFIILPCLHAFASDGRWQDTDIEDENKITLSPSILCMGQDGKACWHGYLTKGELV